jgi:hypothetical protein
MPELMDVSCVNASDTRRVEKWLTGKLYPPLRPTIFFAQILKIQLVN